MHKSFTKAIRLTEKEKSTNYIKAQIKNTVQDALYYQSINEQILASTLLTYVEDLVNRYYLNDWFQQKFAYVEIENTNISIFEMISEKFSHLAEASKLKKATLNLN